MYKYKEEHPNSSMILAEEYTKIFDFLRTDDVQKKGTTGQIGEPKWRSKIRSHKFFLETNKKTGVTQMFKEVEVTDKQPNKHVLVVQMHKIPEILHNIHVNVLGHAGPDATVAEVSFKKMADTSTPAC